MPWATHQIEVCQNNIPVMTFESFTFKPNPKKVKEDNLENIYIACTIAVFVVGYFLFLRGLLPLLIIGGISFALIQLKMTASKKKGANRFGSLVERLILTTELLTIGDKQYKLDELEKFDIDASDFLGKPGDFLASSEGTDNFIEFTLNGVDHSFQFQVKRKTDLKLLSEIDKQIKHSIRQQGPK
jgi:hypothetical protein